MTAGTHRALTLAQFRGGQEELFCVNGNNGDYYAFTRDALRGIKTSCALLKISRHARLAALWERG